MTVQEIQTMIRQNMVLYRNVAKPLTDKEADLLIATWADALSDVPSAAGKLAFRRALRVCHFPVLIADLYDSFPEEYKPEIYSDPAQFIIILKDLTYSVEDKEDDAKELRISFKSPRSGNREYDKKILMFCLDDPKSRQEIQDFIELSDKKHFVSSILNPLLDSELLISTQEYAKSPNQKYYTNKNKIRFI